MCDINLYHSVLTPGVHLAKIFVFTVAL